LDTSAITAAQSQKASQLTPNSVPNALLNHPNAEFRQIHALSAKLGNAVRWTEVITKDGRRGWSLYFDAELWDMVDGELVRKELKC
jgi:hypothetical protein